MAVRKFASIVDASPDIKILIEPNTTTFSSSQRVSLVAKESDWKHGKVFYPLTFMASEEKFSFFRDWA